MQPATTETDPALHLPRSTYHYVLHLLRGFLPDPEDTSPEALAHRDNAAIAQVAAMLPVNADEATLAAQCIGTRAYAAHCLRQARDHAGDLSAFIKCTAQASRMTRDADRARLLLQRMQAERRRREQDDGARETDAWTEHCAVGFMTRSMQEAPPTLPPEPPEEPRTEPMKEADRYAVIYPQRAALIRRVGRVPDNVSFGPPDEELVHALVTGRTPALLALDQAECLAGRSAVSADASRD